MHREAEHVADLVENGLPSGVALAWGVAERPQRGPKRELSVERIVEAAVAIADDEGLGAVSMAKVAASLGFTTMSLYRYVTSKDDLLMLMQDTVAADAIPGPSDDLGWREGLRAWVVTQIANVYMAHPWFGEIPITSVPLTPNNLLVMDSALHAMRDLPLTAQEKTSTVLLLSGYARAVGTITSGFARAVKAGGDAADISGSRYEGALRELVTPERFPDLAPLVQSGEYTSDGDDDTFEFGLERILDGLAAHIASEARPPVAHPTPAVTEPYPHDKDVREAMKATREAASRLREATKREKELVARARERAAKKG
jgi:AcrR family transcriptional regulator